MVVAAGSSPTIYKPSIWVAERNTALPSASLPFRAAWNTGWEKFQGLPEDATLDFSNPKEGIKTKDLGELDRVPTGEDSIGLKMSTAVPKAVDLTRAYNLVRSAVAAKTGAVAPAVDHPAFEHAYFDPHADTNFMIGLEGYAQAGGLYANERFVRAFIYNVEQAEEGGRGGGGGGKKGGGGGGGKKGGDAGEPGQMKFGWSNEGAVVVAYQIKAFTEPGRDALVVGTGYGDSPQLDPQSRLDMFYIDIPPVV